MPNYNVEVWFGLRADDAEDAGRKAFEILASDPTLEVKVAERVTTMMTRPSQAFRRGDVVGGAQVERSPTTGDAVYRVEVSLDLQAESAEAAAQDAFRRLAEDTDLPVSLHERVSGAVFKPEVQVTRAELFADRRPLYDY